MKLSIKQVILWFSLFLLTLTITGVIGFKQPYIKDELINLIYKITNRNLVINGDMSVTIFPQPKLEATAITLKNKPNFTEDTFASAAKLTISVDWLPLLVDKKLVINNLILNDVKLNLITNKHGEINWQSPTQKPGNNPGNPAQNKTALDSLITHLSLENAQVHWQDQQTGTELFFQKLSARIENIGINKPINFAITTAVDSNLISNPGKLTWQGKGVIDKQLDHLTLNESELLLSGFQQNHTVDKPLAANNLRIAPLTTLLSATAIVSISPFNPKQLAAHLNLHMPTTQANYALTEFSAAFSLHATHDSINLSNLTAKLDKSQFSGNLTFNHNNPIHLAFDIAGNQLNLDHYYLSPELRHNQPVPPITQPLAVNIPTPPKPDLLKLNMDGTLQLQHIVINKVSFNDASLRLLSTQGNLNIEHVNQTH